MGVEVSFAGYAPLGVIAFRSGNAGRNAGNFERLCGEMFRRGVILYSVCYPSFSHAETDVDEALNAFEDSLSVMKKEERFS